MTVWLRCARVDFLLFSGTNLREQAFASRYPELSFVHAYPGWVDTSGIKKMTGRGSSVLGPLGAFVAKFVATSADTCADYMWYGLFQATPGWSRTGAKGEPVTDKLFTEGVVERLWEHTARETNASV